MNFVGGNQMKKFAHRQQNILSDPAHPRQTSSLTICIIAIRDIYFLERLMRFFPLPTFCVIAIRDIFVPEEIMHFSSLLTICIIAIRDIFVPEEIMYSSVEFGVIGS